MARRSLRHYYELLLRAEASLRTSKRLLVDVEVADDYDVAFRKTVVTKQFELAYELLVKLMFKAADQLPEPTGRTTALTWPEAHRLWTHMGIGAADQNQYNAWKKVRNQTVHTYNAEVYDELLAPVLLEFERELRQVLKALPPHLPSE